MVNNTNENKPVILAENHNNLDLDVVYALKDLTFTWRATPGACSRPHDQFVC